MERYLEFALNHYILSLSFAVVTYLLIQELFDTAFKRFASITPLTAVNKMNATDDVVIIDVRDPIEFTSKHIDQAINISLDKLPEQLAKLEQYKTKSSLIICQDGIRSGSAAKILTKAEFQNVFVITGGMTAWEDEYKLPVKVGNKQPKAKAKTNP
jgi:rhodanese-related sulfurtransferase